MNLVTGATGLLGSHIVEKLKEQGQPVRALVRKGSDTRVLENWGVELAYGDVTDLESVIAACKGVTTVYHSAAAVGDWGSWENYFVPVTIGGSKNMIEAARKNNIKRFLHISSISAYGHPNKKGMVVDESYPLGQQLLQPGQGRGRKAHVGSPPARRFPRDGLQAELAVRPAGPGVDAPPDSRHPRRQGQNPRPGR